MAQLGKTHFRATSSAADSPAVDHKNHSSESAERKSPIENDEEGEENNAILRPETALIIKKPEQSYDSTGNSAYVNACRHAKIPKSRRITLQLLNASQILDCAHYGLGVAGCKALSMALVLNSTVSTLILRDNNIGVEGLEAICDGVKESVSISAMDLSNNQLGSEGALVLAKFLDHNHSIKSLNLSSNNFTDADAEILCDRLSENKILTALDLSHNNFNVGCGQSFEQFLTINETLKELDLSWNSIRLAAIKRICQGLKANITLESMSLAWNGLGPNDTREIVGVLTSQSRLREFDLSSNRLPPSAFPPIAKALLENDCIEIFRYGYNKIAPQDGKNFITSILQMEEPTLKLIDFMGIFFDKEFEKLIEQLHSEKENIKIIHGYNDLYGKRKLKGYNAATEAMETIKAYLAQHNVKLVDLFAEFDEDGSMSVSYDEFRMGIKQAGIPLTDQQVTILIQEIDADGDGDIDFSEFAIGAEGTDD